MSMREPSKTFKPLRYPWAYEAYKKQQHMHWLPEEVPLADDVLDWKRNLSESERYLLTQIFRFFTQSDVEVAKSYLDNYIPVFENTEIRMMLTCFAAMEANHIDAYSHLLDTIGMPEVEYSAFLEYEEMKNKYEYLQYFDSENDRHIATTMAVFGAFVEGTVLFSSFAILLNFQRFGKMKGVGQIVAWSAKDEHLHTQYMIEMFHNFVKETPGITLKSLKKAIIKHCDKLIKLEDKFIDLCFSMGDIEGITGTQVKDYIRYVANKRLIQLGYEEYYDIKDNPLPWVEELIFAKSHVNFFEGRVTEYARGETRGDWSDVF